MQMHRSESNLLPPASMLNYLPSAYRRVTTLIPNHTCSGNLGSTAEQSSSANQTSLRSSSLELFTQDLLRNQRFRLGLRRVKSLNVTNNFISSSDSVSNYTNHPYSIPPGLDPSTRNLRFLPRYDVGGGHSERRWLLPS